MPKMTAGLAMAVLLGFSSGSHLSLADSEAIDIARQAARAWEGTTDGAKWTFDVVDPSIDKLAGFTSVIFYVDNDPVLDISIDLASGEVVDRNRCVYFDGPYFSRLRKKIQALTHSKELPRRTLATKLGCDRLSIKRYRSTSNSRLKAR